MPEENLTFEGLFVPRIKGLSKEEIYGTIKIYLQARIEYRGNPKVEDGSLLYDIFALCEKEIMEREMAEGNERRKKEGCIETKSEYLVEFGDLLAKAGIKHPYEITKVN